MLFGLRRIFFVSFPELVLIAFVGLMLRRKVVVVILNDPRQSSLTCDEIERQDSCTSQELHVPENALN
jgi:hypothetical protein